MPHILFINQHYYPDFAATGQLLAELCEDLSQKGFRITVITGYPEKGTYPDYLTPLKNEQHKNLTIYRIYNHPAGNKSNINRLFHFFSFWLGSVVKALFMQEKYDLIYVMSTPPLLNGITANLVSFFRGVPYLYNVQDLYPGIAVEMGTLTNKHIISISQMIENYINQNALSISTLSVQMKKSISEHAEPNKIVILPNWSDGNLIRPQKESQLRKKIGLTEMFLVTYSGNMGMSQGLDSLLGVAEILQTEKPNIHFLFIGNGAHLPELKKIKETNNLKNVTFLPYQPKENLSDSLACADLHLISTTPNLSKYLMPSKLYGILAAGKSYLAVTESTSEIVEFTVKESCGVTANPGDIEQITSAIIKLEENVDVLQKMGKLGREVFDKQFERKIVTEKYAAHLRNILR